MSKIDEHPTVKLIRSRESTDSIEQSPLDASELRSICLEAGADDVGFVEISRAELNDQRDDIFRFFSPTRTLISFVCRMNREPVRNSNRSVSNLEFHSTTDRVNDVLKREQEDNHI